MARVARNIVAHALAATMVSAGMARQPMRQPTTAAAQRRIDPPMPEAVLAMLPEAIKATGRGAAKRLRHAAFGKSPQELIAEARRARRNAKRLSDARRSLENNPCAR